MRIADFVLQGRKYDAQNDFSSLKAPSLYHRARDEMHDAPVDSANRMLDALKLHCKVYQANIAAGDFKAAVTERYIRNTAYSLFRLVTKSLHLDQALSFLVDVLTTTTGFLDPTEPAVKEAFGRIYLKGYEASVLHRARKELSKVIGSEVNAALWMDQACWTGVREVLTGLDDAILATLRQRNSKPA